MPPPANPNSIERRPLGRTGAMVSPIGFGGIIVMNESERDAREWVAEAVARGVNYFDVAPGYGDAEERLGPALAPYRSDCFLACKTEKRTGPEARASLENSLRLMQTDHFDLFQLHAITELAEVEAIFAPGSVMDVLVEARREGKIRYLGFSAHSHRAAMLAMDRFDFDTVLFPFSAKTWHESEFGEAVHARAVAKNMGCLALKAMAWRKWPDDLPAAERRWAKAWYEPIDDPDLAALALRFTLNLPVASAIPPGHWELFGLALRLAESGALRNPLTAEEEAQLFGALNEGEPVFDRGAAR